MENDLQPIPGFGESRADGISHSGEDVSVRTNSSPVHHMSLWVAVIFIVGEMAGSGVLALPKALAGTGWIGLLILLFCCFSAGYSGIHLGKCWVIMEERWPEYRGKIRYPYPAVGDRVFGPKMRYVVSGCVILTLFGAAVVYLLLCSQLIGNLLNSSTGVLVCHWVLILGAILCPFTWLGTPADFWPAAVLALGTTSIACVLLIIAMATQAYEALPDYKSVGFMDVFLSFGTILFAFGGASTFLTFQNDMKDKTQFTKAATLGFVGLISLYLPVAVVGYYVYGSYVNSNVVNNLDEGPLRITIEVLLGAHFFFALLIVVNPVAQELEERIRVPSTFGWKRCVTRTVLMAAVIFVGETIPHFGKILNLVGGSTVTLMTFVFPPLFYMKLCQKDLPVWPGREIPLYKRVYLIEIIVIGVIGGGMSIYSAISDICDPAAFTNPCYIDIHSGND